MDSYLGYLHRKAEFTHQLAAGLAGCEPRDLAERTGLLDATIRALLAGDGELMSWEVVSACLSAVGADRTALGEARARWVSAEQAMWDERGDALRAVFEGNPNGKPAKIAEIHRSKAPWRRLTSRFPVTLEPWAEPKLPEGRQLPDPATAGDIREFYGLLAQLRSWAGSPRQSEIERRSWGALPDATLSAMLQKDRWRTPNDRERRRIDHFAAACGLPESEAARWVDAYERLRHIPPPDDLARARAEEVELRRLLADARAEAEELRRRLHDAEGRRPRPGRPWTADEPADEPAGDPRNGSVVATGPEADPAAISAAAPEVGRAAVPAAGPTAGPTVERRGDRRGGSRSEPGGEQSEGVSGHLGHPDQDGSPRTYGRWDPRRPGAVSVAAAVMVFAFGVLVGGFAVGGTPSRERSICFDGTLHLLGSTAFERMAVELKRSYEGLCPDARVEVNSEGSNEGVRTLTAGAAASAIVMHDGRLRPDSTEVRFWGLRAFPVAVVTFAIVAHKDVNVSDLSMEDLRSVYAPERGPTRWSQVRGGANTPIRLVGRTDGSGTRAIFEERVLRQPEPGLSSGDCLSKDEIRAAARIIRCERSSQAQVLDMVNRVPGAIGYAELHAAADRGRYPDLRILTLDGRRAGTTSAGVPYPFTAPEVFYTYGFPANGSPVSAFLTFLTGETARRRLERAGFPSCVEPDAGRADLCRGA